MVGRTVSHYRILAPLGAGGMGVVYRAEDVRLGREVALKFVSDDLAHDEQAVRRLRSEARAASALNHANICTIYDIDEHEGHPFIVMELMRGRTLRDALAAGPLKIHQMVDAGIEIADALQAAHSQGIVHRDIKPGNVFLTERSHVKILDFGLAKLTARMDAGSTGITNDSTIAGVTLGTVHYMSPEQATGEELDGRTDLFSLGVVLYECATGRHPFPGKTSAVILDAILNRAPVAPVTLNAELPLRLQDVINNCLEKDRELRYQSAADLRADLKRVRRDLESGHSQVIETVPSRGTSQAGVRTPSAGSRTVPERRASRFLPGFAILAAVIVVIALVAAGSYAVRRRAPERAAQDASNAAVLSDAAMRGRLALASSSLDARNYRSALAYAAEVLAAEPDHVQAAKIRDEAQAMLQRFDATVADARRQLSAGDIAGAARSLDAARAIDPTAPSVSELSARLADQVRQRETAPQARPRPAPDPPAGAPQTRPPAPPPSSPPPQSRPAAPEEPPAARTQTPVAPVEPPPAPAPPATIPPPPEPAPSRPAPAPPAASERREAEPPPAAPSAEEDEAAIRKVTAAYARAIENKDLALFRSIKPSLSSEEERRLQAGFRAVASQRVSLTVQSIQRRGDEATVVVRRHDTIDVGRRQQTADSQQTLTMARARGGWVITDIR